MANKYQIGDVVDTDKTAVHKYLLLMKDFVNNEINAIQFEETYLREFKREDHIFSDEVYQILAILFSDVDAFCSDANLRDEHDIDELELKARVEMALKKLTNLGGI